MAGALQAEAPARERRLWATQLEAVLRLFQAEAALRPELGQESETDWPHGKLNFKTEQSFIFLIKLTE